MTNLTSYLIAAAIALICAGLLATFGQATQLPVIGTVSLFPATALMACIGAVAMTYLSGRAITPPRLPMPNFRAVMVVTGLGLALAVPPILIDLVYPFPREMNLPLPDALWFYPAIALVAEVQFHLVPLVILALILPRSVPARWLALPVILVEPLFQIAFLSGASMQMTLVLLNVGLISAVQMWLFLRHGFLAMIGLRIAFYLAWHIIWGTLRLDLLF